MNAPYTHGPWFVSPGFDEDGYRQHAITGANNSPLAILRNYSPIEQRANAMLIAAAPDLLAALKALEPHLDAIVCYASTMDEYEPNKLVAKARAAIAKAAEEML